MYSVWQSVENIWSFLRERLWYRTFTAGTALVRPDNGTGTGGGGAGDKDAHLPASVAVAVAASVVPARALLVAAPVCRETVAG